MVQKNQNIKLEKKKPKNKILPCGPLISSGRGLLKYLQNSNFPKTNLFTV